MQCVYVSSYFHIQIDVRRLGHSIRSKHGFEITDTMLLTLIGLALQVPYKILSCIGRAHVGDLGSMATTVRTGRKSRDPDTQQAY